MLKLMKSRWLKPIFTLLTLMFCMSVTYLPALAAEVDWEWGEPAETVEQITDFETGDMPLMDTETAAEPEDEPEGEEIPEEIPAIEGTGFRPFTPAGTGSVIDNASDGDGKEFYTIKTEDGSVFYLIIDRQRNTQNVYFLNAVTEEDLMALAEKNGKTISSNSAGVAPTVDQPGVSSVQKEPPVVTPEPEAGNTGGSTMTYIFIGVVVLVVGGVAYYLKIVKGKNNAGDDDEDGEDTDVEYDYDDEPDDDENDNEAGEEGDE